MNPVDSWQLTVDNWEGHGKVYAYIAVAVLARGVSRTYCQAVIFVFHVKGVGFISYLFFLCNEWS